MKPWYAINARQLLESRIAGELPERPVNVVLTAQTEPAPALYVRDDMPADRLDWRMLVNLEVWLWASPRVALDRVLRVARGIAAVRPKRLVLRFDTGDQVHDLHVGHGHHQRALDGIVPELHDFTWAPLDLTLTAVGAQLRRALLAELPMWSPL